MRSMLGVGKPTRPREYALRFVCPTSSSKMTRMFGFFSWPYAAVRATVSREKASDVTVRHPSLGMVAAPCSRSHREEVT